MFTWYSIILLTPKIKCLFSHFLHVNFFLSISCKKLGKTIELEPSKKISIEEHEELNTNIFLCNSLFPIELKEFEDLIFKGMENFTVEKKEGKEGGQQDAPEATPKEDKN